MHAGLPFSLGAAVYILTVLFLQCFKYLFEWFFKKLKVPYLKSVSVFYYQRWLFANCSWDHAGPFSQSSTKGRFLIIFWVFPLQSCVASNPVLFRFLPTRSIWPFFFSDGHENSPTQFHLNRKAPTFCGGWFWETNMGDFRRQIRSWDRLGSWERWRRPSAWAVRDDW